MLLQDALRDIITHQLAGCLNRRATAVGDPPPKPAPEPFIPSHPYHPIYRMLVLPALVYGKSCVVLHAYVEHIGEVAGDAAQKARKGGHRHEEWEAGVGTRPLLHFLVYAETDGGIGHLAEKRGSYPSVESEEALVLEDFRHCAAQTLECA